MTASPAVEPRYRLLALDYDRTLTDPPRGVQPKVLDALARARLAGVKVALVSGNRLSVLQGAVPGLDAYITENGAVRRCGDAVERTDWPDRPALLEALGARGVPYQAFDVLVDVPRTTANEAALAALLPGFDAVAVPNVDRINVQPPGITKGTGLAWLRRRLGVPKPQVLAMGDGENDVALFKEAGLSVAVANASSEARAAAMLQADLPNGDGVAALVEALLADRLPGPEKPG